MEENTEISRSNKIKIIVITALIFIVSIAGISYAYFTIQVVGNETASSMRLRTANMQLIYNDVQIVSGEYAQPGWTQTKTLTVQNTGNVATYYTIIWRDLYNEVINEELVISATCSSSSGSCSAISETIVPTETVETDNVRVKRGISIGPGVTHTYTVTALFKETGSNQNYNQNKEFYGTLNIADSKEPMTITRNGTDSTTGLPVVRIGTTEEFYDITNAINYTNLINTNKNIYNYTSGKSVLLAKYNLYVGKIYQSTGNFGNTFVNNISSSDTGYGLQNMTAKAWTDSSDMYIGTVPFASTGTLYWKSGGLLKPQYGASNSASNIYDAAYSSAPNWNKNFIGDSENANYSLAYFVEEYMDTMAISGSGRILTYTEEQALLSSYSSIIYNNASYWLASSADASRVYSIWTNTLSEDNAHFPNSNGVRPVIVVNTSDIQNS